MYGYGRLTQANEMVLFFKNYGFSDSQLILFSENFDSLTITIIDGIFARVGVKFTGNDLDAIGILFKGAGSVSTADTMANGIVALANSWSILPSQYESMGMNNLPAINAGLKALNAGVSPSIMAKLAEMGIGPDQYVSWGIINTETAIIESEAMAKALTNSISADLAESLIPIPKNGAGGIMYGPNIPGGYVTGRSTGAGGSGASHPVVIDLYELVPKDQRRRFHGQCAEASILSEISFSADVKSIEELKNIVEYSTSVVYNRKRVYLSPCPSCGLVLDILKIAYRQEDGN
jgi:hypothetical protein